MAKIVKNVFSQSSMNKITTIILCQLIIIQISTTYTYANDKSNAYKAIYQKYQIFCSKQKEFKPAYGLYLISASSILIQNKSAVSKIEARAKELDTQFSNKWKGNARIEDVSVKIINFNLHSSSRNFPGNIHITYYAEVIAEIALHTTYFNNNRRVLRIEKSIRHDLWFFINHDWRLISPEMVAAMAASFKENPVKNQNINNSSYIANFLGRDGVEGNTLNGVIPGEISGVTIAIGIDLGQHSVKDIEGWNIPQVLKNKLIPYATLQGKDASNFSLEHPLEITQLEANELNAAVIPISISKAQMKYDSATSGPKFSSLPIEAQAVLVSVYHQYQDGAPNFWLYAEQQQWTGPENSVIAELLDFGDIHQDRHTIEANLLKEAIDRGALK